MSSLPKERSYLPPEEPLDRTSGLARASFILGILSWCAFPLVCGIAAVVAGHKARIDIAKSEGRLTGDTIAVVGLWLGYANILLIALICLCAAGFFLFISILDVLSSL
jgi:hypothetical protein